MRLDLPSYKQGDPKWKNIVINGTKSTLGRYGCTITIIGDLFNKTPRETNTWLKSLGAFQGDLVLWLKTPFWKHRFYCPKVPAPMSAIKAYLRARKPVLLQVSFQKNWLKPNHWVLATGYDGDTIYINDPWYGDKTKLAPRYGITSSIAILGGAYFDKQILLPKPPPPPKDPCAPLKVEIQALKNDMDAVQGTLKDTEERLENSRKVVGISIKSINTLKDALRVLRNKPPRIVKETIVTPAPKLSAVEHLNAWWNIIFKKRI